MQHHARNLATDVLEKGHMEVGGKVAMVTKVQRSGGHIGRRAF